MRTSSATPNQIRALGASLDILPLIGILRSCPPKNAQPVAEAAFDAGLSTIEVSLDSDSGLTVLSELRSIDPQHCIGAGSVVNASQVQAAWEIGADYIVSPVVSEKVLSKCTELEIPCIAGGATPTEIVRALDLGAFAVKLFPADLLGGPDFVSSIMRPLGSPPLIAIGGISEVNGRSYLEAGAMAIGVGTGLFSEEALVGRHLEVIGACVNRFVEALR